MDDVIDAADYPLEEINEKVRKERRIGLGFTGLGNVFTMLRFPYGSEESKEFSHKLGEIFRDSSYEASIDLAIEKGNFPLFDADKFVKSGFVRKLPKKTINRIKKYGMRNITLNTIPPTGTTSLSIGNNCSSGIEPSFNLSYSRTIRTDNEDKTKTEIVYDYAWLHYISKELNIPLTEAYKVPESVLRKIKIPEYFSTVIDVSPKDAIDIQSIFQSYIDSSISKTHSLKPGTTLEEYKDLFLYAYEKELKGFTTFNPDGKIKGIIEYSTPKKPKNEISIERREAPKRPVDLECDIHEITVSGEKYIVLVGKLNGSLYEVFVDKNENGDVNVGRHKYGILHKRGRGSYDLIVGDNGQTIVIKDISNTFDQTYVTLARLVSTGLRHGVPLQFLVDQLSKSKNFLGFERSVSRVLKKYIKDGEVVMTSQVCPECGGELVYREGCAICPNCGWGKCS